MPDPKHREIYARTKDGGVQLAASTDRWHLYEDHVHLACWGFSTTTEKFASTSEVRG